MDIFYSTKLLIKVQDHMMIINNWNRDLILFNYSIKLSSLSVFNLKFDSYLAHFLFKVLLILNSSRIRFFRFIYHNLLFKVD